MAQPNNSKKLTFSKANTRKATNGTSDQREVRICKYNWLNVNLTSSLEEVYDPIVKVILGYAHKDYLVWMGNDRCV